MKLLLSLALLFIMILLTSCHKQEEEIFPEPGYDYFPVKKGQWIVYQVDTVFVNGFITDTSHWEVKDISTGIVEVNSNGECYSGIQRYIRKTGTGEWSEMVLEFVVLTTSSHVMVKNGNHFYVAMVFPVSEGITWDGNAFNGFESQEYTMKDVGQSFTVDRQIFQESLKVVEMEHTTLISQDISEKVFSRGIGMIYARKIHLINLQSIQNKSGIIVENRIINSGF
ncbi:MAG: hypothetical protein AB9842_09530 [Bacteroidales bacterium]